MRLAEVFLRLGCSLVGWMVVIAYVLWLAVAGRVGCSADGDQLYRLLLFLAPFAAVLSALTALTRPLAAVHDMLRWIGVLPALLLPVALLTVIRFGGAVIVDGSAICGVGTPPAWQLLWPWLQVVALATCAVVVGRAFMARDARE